MAAASADSVAATTSPREPFPRAFLPWGINPHDAVIGAIAVPAIGTIVLDPVMSLVDTAVVGRLGAKALAGVGLGAVTTSFIVSLLIFLSVGTMTAVARAAAVDADWAQDQETKATAAVVGEAASLGAAPGQSMDEEGTCAASSSSSSSSSDDEASCPPFRRPHAELARVLGQSVALASAVGLVAGAALLAGAGPAARALASDPDVARSAVDYMRWRAVGVPFLAVQFTLSGCFRGLRDTLTPFRAAVTGNFVNLGGDILLVFGLGWGVAGAAFATSLSQAATCLFLLWHIGRGGRLSFADVVAGRMPSEDVARPLLATGASLTLRTVVAYASVLLASTLASRLGAVSLAGHEVVRQLGE